MTAHDGQVLKVGYRIDFRASPAGASAAARYAAAIEMCEWGDVRGIDHVRLSEHHGADDEYCPSPAVAGAAIAARTKRMMIVLGAAILPLHDPLRLAEDYALLDIVSSARLFLGVVAGYVPFEFAMFGKDPRLRQADLEEGLEAIKQAWTGEPFEFRGRACLIRPRPMAQPRPPLWLGGSTVAHARKAARLADGMIPSASTDEVMRAYFDERERLGLSPGHFFAPSVKSNSVIVAEDPERLWSTHLGKHAMVETNSYAAYSAAAAAAGRGGTTNLFRPVTDVDQVKASGRYQCVTPEECIALYRALGPHERLTLNPLVGGLPPDVGWTSLELFEAKVMPAIGFGVSPKSSDDRLGSRGARLAQPPTRRRP